MNRKLYVGNLAYETSETDLEALFGQAGQVESVRVMRDKATGQARGFAFVEMANETDAQAAIDRIHELEVSGRRIVVNEARPQPERSGGFGGDRGPRRRSEPRW
jgi:RNA recognition motif-containing protein